MTVTLGIDLGGTKILAAAVDERGSILAEVRHPTPTGGEAIVESMAVAVDELRAREPLAVGVGSAGLVGGGIVHYSPNIPGLNGFPLASLLGETIGMPVVLDNDANAAAWGEVVHGAAAGHREVLAVTLGTGIGGGIVTDGALYRGARGFAAEIGHITVLEGGPRCACGERGHWEAMASGTALGRMARERVARGELAGVLRSAGGDPDLVRGAHVGAAAQAGDAEAASLVAELADWAAVGLAGLVNVLDPELVVVGGGLVDLGDVLMEPLRRSFSRRIEGGSHRPGVPLVPAQLGERAGAVGAAALAREGCT